ncbi:hypothetical protein MC885_003743 [Smutsia gigantea]|nr:hypothetical protein MC885_003743 [Smutsia gigantea]
MEFPERLEETKLTVAENEDHEKLQVKIQAFEDKINAESNTPGSVRRYSLGQISKEERKDIRFNRSRSLALHAVLAKSMSSDDGEAIESGAAPTSISLSALDPLGQGNKPPFQADTDGSQLRNSLVPHPSLMHIESANLPETVKENCHEETPETSTSPVEYQDKLYLHLKENFSEVKAYAVEIGKKIPAPDQCTIEGYTLIEKARQPVFQKETQPKDTFKACYMTKFWESECYFSIYFHYETGSIGPEGEKKLNRSLFLSSVGDEELVARTLKRDNTAE